MISQVELEFVNKCPTGFNSWEVKTTKMLVQFPVRKFTAGEVFGHQELVELLRQRQFELDNPDLPK